MTSVPTNSQSGYFRPTWCEIDLGAIKHNTRQLKEMVGRDVQLLVCLKGDALACGAERIAAICEQSGADGFAFGNIDAAIACRRAGVSLPMLLYPNCLPESASILEEYRLIPTISTMEDVHGWERHVKSSLDVFLKIDSGGLRAGAAPRDSQRIAVAIASSKRLRLAGVYGHTLASYHVDSNGVAEKGPQKQLEVFLGALMSIEDARIEIPIRMFSSSEIVVSQPEADLNAVEPGRLVLGLDFPAVASRERVWMPALVGFKSRIVTKKRLDIAFASKQPSFFPLRDEMVIGLLPLGWSDGYPKTLPKLATALVRGKRVSLLGPVHSELLRIDLTDVPEAEVGDEVVLLGASGSEQILLHDLAQQWGVSVADVYTGIGKTLPRVYLNE